MSTALTTPIKTSDFNDSIDITNTGSVKPTAGAAVTVDTNNDVKNEGTIQITGADNATGILANPNLTANITNSGTITLDEDYTPTDTDNDGDLDGPFAMGTNRYGIHVLGGGTFTGNIVNSGGISIEGNNSAGIAIDGQLNGSLNSTGQISVIGDNSVGIRTAGVSGDVSIGNASGTNVKGLNSVGVLIGGDVGGKVSIQGTITSTGYRSVTAPADTSTLDADDLLQGGSALVISGNVAHGILLDAPPPNLDPNNPDEDNDGIPDANETTAKIFTWGSAPAMVIGSATQDISIGAVPSSTLGDGLVIKGTVGSAGVYDGVNSTGLLIGGMGHTVDIAGGMAVSGAISSLSVNANATALHIGAGATVPQIIVSGAVAAEGGGADSTAVNAILIDSGATVNAISNGGTIAAQRDGDSGTAAAIVDKSGTVSIVQNSGKIIVSDFDVLGSSATAIDLSANTTGATVRQIAPGSGTSVPQISGAILFGSGNDLLDIQAGNVFGSVDFGAGTNLLTLSGTSVFRGTIQSSGTLAATVGTGSTLDIQNIGTVNLASLTLGDNASLGVTVGENGHTLVDVAGTASFGTGSKILVTLDHVGSAAGTYTILDAGTLTGADNLTSSIVTLPFLFDSKLIADSASGQVKLEVDRKDSTELGLNSSENAILDAAIDAADSDHPIAGVFLSAQDAAALKSTLQQLMPDHAGGAFETATKGSRLASDFFSDPRPVTGIWLQQVLWGSSKSIGDTASYDVQGWGANIGYDQPIGRLGSVGLTAAYYYGHDGKDQNELQSDHYEGGVYWRSGDHPLRGWARATIGTIAFKSVRNFSADLSGTTITRSASGHWNGRIYSAAAGLSYEARAGRFSFRPNASVDYYKLNEKGYTETGGGDAFDLTVMGRSSSETAANLMLNIGYDILKGENDSGWMRVEAEGGRREILGGSLGDTEAAYVNGDLFTLNAEQRKSGWTGGARLLGGGSTFLMSAEANAQQLQGDVSLGGRMSLSLAF